MSSFEATSRGEMQSGTGTAASECKDQRASEETEEDQEEESGSGEEDPDEESDGEQDEESDGEQDEEQEKDHEEQQALKKYKDEPTEPEAEAGEREDEETATEKASACLGLDVVPSTDLAAQLI